MCLTASSCLSAAHMHRLTIHPSLVSSSRKKYNGKDKENDKYPVMVIFTVCLNAAFTEKWQNHELRKCSSKSLKNINGTTSWMY